MLFFTFFFVHVKCLQSYQALIVSTHWDLNADFLFELIDILSEHLRPLFFLCSTN